MEYCLMRACWHTEWWRASTLSFPCSYLARSRDGMSSVECRYSDKRSRMGRGRVLKGGFVCVYVFRVSCFVFCSAKVSDKKTLHSRETSCIERYLSMRSIQRRNVCGRGHHGCCQVPWWAPKPATIISIPILGRFQATVCLTSWL